MTTTIERIVLYGVVLILAGVVGVLALQIGEFKSSGIEGFTAALDAKLDAKFAGLEQRVADDVAGRIEKLIGEPSGDLGDFRGALDGIDETLAATVDGKLVGLEGRVADSVCEKLSEGACTRNAECRDGADSKVPSCPPVTTCEECGTQCPDCPEPPLLSVASTFTLLYENARLNEEREVTEDSFGVRLAPRHIKRLDLLANAFQACQQEDDPVQFHVTGFSSTAEFRTEPEDEPLPDSDALNLTTANLRATIVGNYLRNQNFQVTVEEWFSFDSLRRPYSDNSQPGTDQQALNRSVFIKLDSAGACDLREIEISAR